MSPRIETRRAAWALALAMALTGRLATAQSDYSASCIDQNADAQRLERSGRLRAAAKKLVACAAPACPSAVRDDCADILRRVEAAMPMVALSVRDAEGKESAAVSVWLDDELLGELPTGRSLAVDPGTHVLRITLGTRRREKSVVFVAGQKDRALSFDFAEAHVETPQRTPPLAPPFRVPWLAWAFGGLAVGSAGAAVYFGSTGSGIQDRLDATCAPSRACSRDDYQSLKTDYTAANVFVGVAVGALSLGVVTAILWPRAKAPSATVGLGGDRVFFGGQF